MMFMSLKPVGWLGQDAKQHDHCYPSHKTIKASADVLAEGFRVVRVGDAVAPHGGSCSKHRTPHGAKVQAGSASVFLNGKPMAREDDTVECATGQTAPLLRGRATVVAGDVSPFAKARTRSTEGADGPTNARPDTGSTGVVGDDSPIAKPGTGSTEVAGDSPRVAGLGTGMSLDGLPQTIRVSTDLTKVFKEAMANSFPNGRSLEQGGTLVRDKETGEVSLFVGNSKGTSGSIALDRNVPAGQEVLGGFHTHPYDKSEGGHTNVSFSGGDFAVMIIRGDSISFVQSGEGQFMLLRTPKTPANVDYVQLRDGQNARQLALVRTGKSFEEASRILAREAAEKYGLAYYEGKNGKLDRVYP